VTRFMVGGEQIVDGRIVLTGPDARHAARVLRLQAGDRFAAVDESGLEHVAEILAVSRSEVVGRILSSTRPDREPRLRLGLLQAVLKGERMDQVLRQCTELGVAEFRLVETRRVVARVPAGRLEGRLARWREIVRSAAEQSGRTTLPAILPPAPWRNALAAATAEGPSIVLYEGDARPFGAVLDEIGRPERLFLGLGPEGGFDDGEIASARAAGAHIASLGRLILRAETASVAAAAIALRI
jgi:16S rRNA (uracil1498-N3)-methyltransferase